MEQSELPSGSFVLIGGMVCLGMLSIDLRWPVRGEMGLNLLLEVLIVVGGIACTYRLLKLMKVRPQVGTHFLLSTLLMLSLTAGALLWANATPRYRYVGTSSGVAAGYYFKVGYGWPFLARREVRDIYELNPPSPDMLWLRNGLTALVILSATFVIWEALLARKQADQSRECIV